MNPTNKDIDKLKEDIKDIGSRLKKITLGTGSSTTETIKERMTELTEQFEDIKNFLAKEAVQTGKKVDDFVEAHHWSAAAILFAAGILAGYVAGKKM